MTSTWVLGDIHGCAEELGELLEGLALGPDDRLISVGDLYHRGPDPVGVMDLLAGVENFSLVLGNHELAMLRRNGMEGELSDGSDFKPLPEGIETLAPELLLGDGGTPIGDIPSSRSADLVRFLEGRPFYLEGETANRPWWVVHAGVIPGRKPQDCTPFQLARLRRLGDDSGAPFWYEVHEGPRLVLFGHTPSKFPRTRFSGDSLVALGLDTGCVYGGCLTAWRLEDEEFHTVPAKRDWAG